MVIEQDVEITYFKDIDAFTYEEFIKEIIQSLYNIIKSSDVSAHKASILTQINYSSIRKMINYIENGTEYNFNFKTINKANEFIKKFILSSSIEGDYDVH